MPLDKRRGLGRFGEQAAAVYLRRAGYLILAHNWRCARGEIDLVARLGDQIVFVEVRTRRAGGPSPEESVGPAKASRLVALGYAYLAAHQLPADAAWRIDLVALELDTSGRVSRLEHLEHAVEE